MAEVRLRGDLHCVGTHPDLSTSPVDGPGRAACRRHRDWRCFAHEGDCLSMEHPFWRIGVRLTALLSLLDLVDYGAPAYHHPWDGRACPYKKHSIRRLCACFLTHKA